MPVPVLVNGSLRHRLAFVCSGPDNLLYVICPETREFLEKYSDYKLAPILNDEESAEHFTGPFGIPYGIPARIPIERMNNDIHEYFKINMSGHNPYMLLLQAYIKDPSSGISETNRHIEMSIRKSAMERTNRTRTEFMYYIIRYALMYISRGINVNQFMLIFTILENRHIFRGYKSFADLYGKLRSQRLTDNILDDALSFIDNNPIYFNTKRVVAIIAHFENYNGKFNPNVFRRLVSSIQHGNMLYVCRR